MSRIFDRPVEEFDAIVVGAALSGVIAATALSARGYKTALLDALPDAGGRVAEDSAFDGYSLPRGHGDGINGIGDLAYTGLVLSSRGEEATMSIRVHNLPEERIGDVSMSDITAQPGADGADPIALFRRL